MVDYLPTLRREFPKKTDLQIEQICVRTPALQELTGHSEHDHRMAAMSLMWPKRINHEWRHRAFRSFQRCKVERKKELLWIGASNSNKTGSLADLALEVWWENPENTSIYITSPYENATERGVWARIIEQFDAATALHDYLPGKIKSSENSIVMYDRNPLSFIELVTVDQVGKLVGKKSSDFGRGMMLIICDELPEFKRNGEALIATLKNIRSVPNFMLIGAGNFADVNDALGQLAEPADEAGYESLDVETSHEWETSRGGLCIRFDGHQSPNVLAGKDIYPVVTTIENLADLAQLEHGTNTPGYYRYGRSFPMLDFNEFTITNSLKVKAGGAYESVVWSSEPQVIGAHCDPGFGGDPCVLAIWRFGWAYEKGERFQCFELSEKPITIPIQVGLLNTDGGAVIVDTQIAERCKKELDKRRIPYSHFSFDDSMRGGIVQAMMRVIGPMVVAISAGGVPTRRILSAVKQTIDPSVKEQALKKVRTARDEFYNFATEMLFAAAAAIDARQLRGLGLSREAVRQLVTRRWAWEGKKKKAETKDKYKAHSSGQSPNEADALVGGIENARRMGFMLASVTLTSGGSVQLILDMLRRHQAQPWDPEYGRQTLPAGHLHSMDAETSLNSGRLNS